MDSIVSKEAITSLIDFIKISKQDPKAEVECKLLSGKIQTKDVADRMMASVLTLAIGAVTEEHRLSITYPDSTRVNIYEAHNIHKLCVTNTFKELPLTVEKKGCYFEGELGKKDVIDVPEGNMRFTMRSECQIKRDWEGNPSDPKGHIRMIHRKSFKTANELFRIDLSMVKTRPAKSRQTIRELLRQPHAYEIEIEFANKKTEIANDIIVKELLHIATVLSQAYYESQFLLKVSDIQKYQQEFKTSGNIFFNPVTLIRRHLNPVNPHNISKGYTVTNKADGDRSGLYVARDRRVLRISNSNQVVWTGVTANDDSHVGDFVDGEYIPDKQLFCIFDIYRFRNRDVRSLPLLKSDEDTLKNPLNSRLGCAKSFVEDIRTQFTMSPSLNPLRVETKLFLAGDGESMEEAIRTMLTTQFEYKTDGLIFTPRLSGVAPSEDRKGKTWNRVYKWKPANQNSIDFLLKISADETFDPILNAKARKGELYVSRSTNDDIIYPRETMNGEYVPRKLPSDLQKVADTNTRIPSVFQPSVPRDPDAYQILVPLNDRNLPVDADGNRIDDNTIVECSFDTTSRRWTIMRTRYDKTYQYRVLREPQYGNDIAVANSIWTSMHVPITEEMITKFMTTTVDDTYEDDMYYRDDLKRCSRVFSDVYEFHNRVKEQLYKQYVKKGDTLLELAVGRGGDLLKWKRTQPSKVVGLDISLANIVSPTQGSAVRYLNDKKNNPHDYIPPVLFIQGDMSVYPLFEQSDKYMPILTGNEKAQTTYLSQFEGLKLFDSVSCQFALHYACESEDMFRNFVKNIETYGKDVFFGTCLDGQSVYSLLMGKKSHLIGSEKQICGEFTKEYLDKDSWVEEFGMPVKVYLESFEKPELEYLVPFERVTQIFEESGFELIESAMFNELYTQQNRLTLTQDQQVFSFLNRTFVFKRSRVKKDPEPESDVVEEELPEKEPVEEKKEEELPEKEEKTVEVTKPKRKLKTGGGDPEIEPLLFFGPTDDEYPEFSIMSNHPIEIDGTKYPTVEHYVQSEKAKLFDKSPEKKLVTEIQTCKTAIGCKRLGDKLPVITEVWDPVKLEVMEKGNRNKFIQHPELRKKLMETGDKIIGFADPRDIDWGIGTGLKTDKAKKPSKWRGKNKLGGVLMTIRKGFMDLED
jgi:ribA/ribD-fused uncharacterized protein